MADNQWNVGSNIGTKEAPAVPMDDNAIKIPFLMGAVVDEGGIIKYLPLLCKDNGDGTATLIIDTSG